MTVLMPPSANPTIEQLRTAARSCIESRYGIPTDRELTLAAVVVALCDHVDELERRLNKPPVKPKPNKRRGR